MLIKVPVAGDTAVLLGNRFIATIFFVGAA
jgi:hypothetical protein